MNRIRYGIFALLSLIAAIFTSLITPSAFLHRTLSLLLCTTLSFHPATCKSNLAGNTSIIDNDEPASAYTYAPNSSIGSNLSILINGNAFFPFGFYHISHYPNEKARRLAALRRISEAGFNVMAVPLDLNDGDFLDEAARLGVSTIGEFNDDPLSIINAYKYKPSILGWVIADDVDNGKKTADAIAKFSNQVKSADPQHLTYVSGGYPKKIANFANLSDLVAMQSYPIPSEPLSTTDAAISSAAKAAIPHRHPVIANLQAFAWQGSRAPSRLEVRNMTYQSLINGVKGIIYYTYYDPTWSITNNRGLWNELKSLVPEIRQLSPFLWNGKLTKVTTGTKDVLAGLWTYQNQIVAVVINTSSDTTRQVDIGFPITSLRTVNPIFPRRASGMVAMNGRLSGEIKPQAVHAYNLYP